MIEEQLLGQLKGNYELFIVPFLEKKRYRMAYGLFSYLTILPDLANKRYLA